MSSSDSDSEASVEIPGPKALENGLRDVVKNIFKSGDLDGLTVKRVRLAAEKALGLQEGYFKADKHWKQQSDQIIKDEVVHMAPISPFRFLRKGWVTAHYILEY